MKLLALLFFIYFGEVHALPIIPDWYIMTRIDSMECSCWKYNTHTGKFEDKGNCFCLPRHEYSIRDAFFDDSTSYFLYLNKQTKLYFWSIESRITKDKKSIDIPNDFFNYGEPTIINSGLFARYLYEKVTICNFANDTLKQLKLPKEFRISSSILKDSLGFKSILSDNSFYRFYYDFSTKKLINLEMIYSSNKEITSFILFDGTNIIYWEMINEYVNKADSTYKCFRDSTGIVYNNFVFMKYEKNEIKLISDNIPIHPSHRLMGVKGNKLFIKKPVNVGNQAVSPSTWYDVYTIEVESR